jgi:Tfp pilus assembly protein FimT
MNFPRPHPSARQQGVSLIECVAYFALFAVVLGVASSAFFRCWSDSQHLRRNADDIARALHAGEQWRADIRAATRPIQVTDLGDTEKVVIPVPAGRILYTCAQGRLQRQAGATAPATVVLDRIKVSRMQAAPRRRVTAWRWELELQPVQAKVRMKPLFTFKAVPAPNPAP